MGKTSRPKTILVDMDGILADILEHWLQIYNKESGESVTKDDITTWDVGNHVRSCDYLYAIPRRPGFFRDIPPLPGAVDGFRALGRLGHEVHVATAPFTPDSAKEKYEWCERYLDLPHQDVIMTHRKEMIAADVLIDDKPETLRKWSDKGSTAATIAWPFNRASREHCGIWAEDYRDTRGAWEQLVEALRGREWTN